MDKDLCEARGAPGANFSPDPLSKVDDTRPDGKTPALITQAVISVIEWEGRSIGGIGSVTDEAASSVGIKANHEEESQVVRIPERLETLVANFVMCRGVHKNHDEQHEVARDTTRLSIVDVQCTLWADLCMQMSRSTVRLDQKVKEKTYG